ncbi:acyltransferase [Bifidobacterium sp. ESL0704]|uniref:acyltransferase family protein n=1 Tax=Bifidobacterium sp. ESL0704 TaxID=2983219 RepID=UPI0023F70B77|nr:acyltransferase [Bifidobacterium sp. ESL0704]WEV52342.1 acyltransferase [Bifidobacterium sp. ESL0704]
MGNKSRDWRFEVLRMVAMLLIVAAHFFSNDNWRVRTDANGVASWGGAFHTSLYLFGQVGVALFVLISAYFLSTSDSNPVARAVRLWAQVFIYSFGIALISVLCDFTILHKGSMHDINRLIGAAFPITTEMYWFMSAFLFMILLGPFMNVLIRSLNRKGLALLLALVVLMVFVAPVGQHLHYFTNVAYLCTVYLIGGFIRRYRQSLPRIRWWHAMLVIVACFAVAVAGTHLIINSPILRDKLALPGNLLTAGEGSTPILAVLAAVALFVCVVQSKKPTRMTAFTRTVLVLSPATLGIYLIHENFIVKALLWGFVFSRPEPAGVIGKALFAAGAILLLYLVSMLMSLLVHSVIIRPVTRLVDRGIIAKFDFKPVSESLCGSGRK